MSRCNFLFPKTLTVDSVCIQIYMLVRIIYVYYHPWDLTAKIKVNLMFVNFLTGGRFNYEKEVRFFSVDS